MSFTALVDFVVGKVEKWSPAALLSVTDWIHLIVLGSDSDRYQTSSLPEKLQKMSEGTTFRFFVAGMACSGEQRR